MTLAPIQCWTRPSTNAVRVGEVFTLVLTCAVVETQSTTVVPDQSRLDPGALQVPPFEVVSGAQAADLRTRTHRYFQYEYRLRFIGEQIGADVELAGPTINYRVQSRVQGDTAVESRERQYVLPSTRVRVASLVPATAGDIQDELPETFRAIEDRRFRASLLRIVSWVLFAVGGVVVLWAFAALVRRPRTEAGPRTRFVSEAAVLRAAARELERVRKQRQIEGWTGDLAARALAPLRIAAAYAAGRVVPQTPVVPPADLPAEAGSHRSLASPPPPAGSGGFRLQPEGTQPGQLIASVWLPRPRRVVVSGAGGAGLQPGPLADAIEKLSAAAYGRGPLNDSDLDEALDEGARGIREVARRYTPWARLGRAVKRSAIGVRDRAWAR